MAGFNYVFPTSYTESTTIRIYRQESWEGFGRVENVTISSIMTKVAASGFNAFFLTAMYNDGSNNYKYVFPFNISSSVDTIYCIDKDNPQIYYLRAGIDQPISTARYQIANSAIWQQGTQNYVTQTINGKTYNEHTNDGSGDPTILVIMNYSGTCYLNENNVTPVVYEWSPFEHLTGNDGQFNMDLTTIDESIIGDGETLTYVSDPTKVNVITRTNLYDLAVNMLDGQEYTIAYCGDNYLTMTRRTDIISAGTDIYVTLKFYFRSDTRIFTSGEYRLRMIGDYPHVTYWLSLIYDEDNEVAAPLLLGGTWYVASTSWNYTFGGELLPSDTEMSALYIWLQDNGNAQSSDPYGTGTTDNGGDPQGTRLQDHITSSPLPTCGGLDIGLVTLYRPTSTQLGQIAAFLWSDNVLDNFKKYFNNFADNILCCYSLPFTPSSLSSKAFTVGNMTSEITGVEYCTVRTFDIDMGSVEVSNRWGSYLDYSPYTKLEIYLPYLGIHSLDIDEIMSPARMDGSMPERQGTVLSLVYRLDILTGIIVAMIKVRVYTKTGGYTDEIRYQFSGKVGYTIPLTGQTFSNLVNAVITAGAGLATTIATGGLTAPMTAGATVTATIQAQKPSIERVGNISGDASMLATNVPYICISVPNKPYMDEQQKFTGFPSYKTGLLSEFSGYTEVLEAHIEGISCTDEEREKILTYLKGGVIL